jgi:hypothetical protein
VFPYAISLRLLSTAYRGRSTVSREVYIRGLRLMRLLPVSRGAPELPGLVAQFKRHKHAAQVWYDVRCGSL